MIKKIILPSLLVSIAVTSCVSKKKLTQAENQLELKSAQVEELTKEKEECSSKVDQFKNDIYDYQAQIENLQQDNADKLKFSRDGVPISAETKQKVKNILREVSPDDLAEAKTFKDSLNAAIAYNIKSNLASTLESDSLTSNSGIKVNVQSAKVEINISEAILFGSGSAFVKIDTYQLIERIAKVINQKPSTQVRIVGHTDHQPVKRNQFVKDNWELSLKRAASVVRILIDKNDVAPERLRASGASKFQPVADNSTPEGRAKNRRVTIVLAPSISTYTSMLD